MRKIGELPDEHQARVFGDALYVRGLENNVESEEAGGFSIWVHDDDQLARGKELLAQFLSRPDAAEWQSAASAAGRKRKQEERENAKRSSNVITRERIEYERNFNAFAWVPMLLVVLSIAATIWAGEIGLMPGSGRAVGGSDDEIRSWNERKERRELFHITKPSLFFDAARERQEARERGESTERGSLALLPEVSRGQVWRLVTPIFLHFGLLHLVFNIMWLRDLGGFMQHRFGPAYLLVFILTVAAVSNLVQFVWTGPNFGGLSGVNYGLLGFLWIRGKFDRAGVWQLNPQVVQMMLLWFFLCFTPLLPNIANGAHAAGLVFGMLAGFTTAKIANTRRSLP